VWQKIRPWCLGFIVGIVVALGASYLFARNADSKLKGDLGDARAALVDAQIANRLATESASRIQSELDGANKIVTEQKRLLSEQQSRFNDVLITIKGRGSDVESQSLAIRDRFDALFGLYHKGSK
jgi:hypothetical protein